MLSDKVPKLRVYCVNMLNVDSPITSVNMFACKYLLEVESMILCKPSIRAVLIGNQCRTLFNLVSDGIFYLLCGHLLPVHRDHNGFACAGHCRYHLMGI